ncbi:MAG: hypothetical protein [Bacteriophage sp.]|nr:MAG: hypothetical protein [Bacteriophage sp.]
MKKIIAAFAIAFASSAAVAQNAPVIGDWTAQDIALEVALAATLVIDHNQTRQIKNHPGLREANPLLGDNPSDSRIRNYFVGAMVTHVVIANALPNGNLRTAFQAGTIAFEVAVVGRNKRMGLRIKF